MTNLLSKLDYSESVFVAPVYRTQLQAVEVLAPLVVGSVRREFRSALPSGMSYAWMDGRHIVFNHIRVVGSTRETWSAAYTDSSPAGLRGFWVKVEVLVPWGTSSVHYSEVKVLVTPGYWQAVAASDSWDAGAYSIKTLRGAVTGKFSVPVRAVGVVCGLAKAFNQVEQEDARLRIAHGFWVSGDTLAIWNRPEAGDGRSGDMQELSPMPAWTPEAVLRVDATGGSVTYYVNDVPVARGVNALGGETVMLAAAMLNARDEVDAPALQSALNDGSGAMTLHLGQRGGDVEVQARGAARLHLAVSSWNHGSRTVLGALRASGTDRSSSGATALKLSLVSYGYGMQGSTGGGGTALRLVAQGVGYPEGSGFGQASLSLHAYGYSDNISRPPGIDEALLMWARIDVDSLPGRILHVPQGVRASMQASLRRPVTQRQRLTMNARHAGSRLVSITIKERLRVKAPAAGGVLVDAALVEALVGGSRLTALMLVDVDLHEVLSGHAFLDGGVLKDGRLIERISAHAGLSAEQLLTAWLREVIGVAAPSAPFNAPIEVFSVRDTGAESEGSSTYDSYNFNSFANIGGNYFGAGEQGLFALEGEDDAGQPIEVHIDLGQRNFDSDHLKALANAYAQTNAAQPLQLLVTMPDGKTYTYPSRGADPVKRTQRFDLGRGLRAHFFGLEIRNDEGAAFELGGLDFNLTESKRRI
ncbi:MAG: hypothetical protein RR715_02945 [Comamonas sp.]